MGSLLWSFSLDVRPKPHDKNFTNFLKTKAGKEARILTQSFQRKD